MKNGKVKDVKKLKKQDKKEEKKLAKKAAKVQKKAVKQGKKTAKLFSKFAKALKKLDGTGNAEFRNRLKPEHRKLLATSIVKVKAA